MLFSGKKSYFYVSFLMIPNNVSQSRAVFQWLHFHITSLDSKKSKLCLCGFMPQCIAAGLPVLDWTGRKNAGLTSRTFCWLGSNMKWNVSFHCGLMSLSMCLVFFLLSGAVGMNNSTYGSGVSTKNTHIQLSVRTWQKYNLQPVYKCFFHPTQSIVNVHRSLTNVSKNIFSDLRRSPSAPLVTFSARTTVTINLWENCCSTCQKQQFRVAVMYGKIRQTTAKTNRSNQLGKKMWVITW